MIPEAVPERVYKAAIWHGVPVLRSGGRGPGTVTLDRGTLRGCPAAGLTIYGIGLQTKLPPNEFTRLILKGRGPRGGP